MQYSKYDVSTLMRWLMVRACRGLSADRETTAPCLLPRENSTNIVADNLAGHLVWIHARKVQPVKEMRERDGIGPLRVDRTIALAQLSQKLIA